MHSHSHSLSHSISSSSPDDDSTDDLDADSDATQWPLPALSMSLPADTTRLYSCHSQMQLPNHILPFQSAAHQLHLLPAHAHAHAHYPQPLAHSHSPSHSHHHQNHHLSHAHHPNLNFRQHTPAPFDKDDGMPKKKRSRATHDQLAVLEDAFAVNPLPNADVRNAIAVRTAMTPRSVQVWFQNKRAKVKLDAKKAAESGAASEDNVNGRPTLAHNMSQSMLQNQTSPLLSPSLAHPLSGLSTDAASLGYFESSLTPPFSPGSLSSHSPSLVPSSIPLSSLRRSSIASARPSSHHPYLMHPQLISNGPRLMGRRHTMIDQFSPPSSATSSPSNPADMLHASQQFPPTPSVTPKIPAVSIPMPNNSLPHGHHMSHHLDPHAHSLPTSTPYLNSQLYGASLPVASSFFPNSPVLTEDPIYAQAHLQRSLSVPNVLDPYGFLANINLSSPSSIPVLSALGLSSSLPPIYPSLSQVPIGHRMPQSDFHAAASYDHMAAQSIHASQMDEPYGHATEMDLRYGIEQLHLSSDRSSAQRPSSELGAFEWEADKSTGAKNSVSTNHQSLLDTEIKFDPSAVDSPSAADLDVEGGLWTFVDFDN